MGNLFPKLPPTDYYWEIRIRSFSLFETRFRLRSFQNQQNTILLLQTPNTPPNGKIMLSHENTGMGMYEHIQRQKHCYAILQHNLKYVPFSISSKNKTWWEDFIEYNDFEISHLVAMIS